jgi:hypothetical protein
MDATLAPGRGSTASIAATVNGKSYISTGINEDSGKISRNTPGESNELGNQHRICTMESHVYIGRPKSFILR